jgi:hypothetical protein
MLDDDLQQIVEDVMSILARNHGYQRLLDDVQHGK